MLFSLQGIAQTTEITSSDARYQKLSRDIFRELIEINTTSAKGSTGAAEAMAARLKTAGFRSDDIQVLGPDLPA